MGFSRKRTGRDGKPRYTAYYVDLKGQERSAGTYGTVKLANKAWQDAEVKLAEGRVGDPARGRMRFQRYVEDAWLPHHVMEPSTRQGYTYALHNCILPELGAMRMIDILPEHIRQWVTARVDEGMKPITIRTYMVIISAIFTTAFNDQVTFVHPCRGVKTPTVAKKQLRIITPEQFDTIYQKLPDADSQLLVETDIESGLRWGELTELRTQDLNLQTRILTVSRAVVELTPEFHPTGGRFHVKDYPKDKEYRQFKLSTQIVAKIQTHIQALQLDSDDLLFAIRNQDQKQPAQRVTAPPAGLGLTEPNDKGKQYQHGTATAYGLGKCRCQHCRAAVALYRAERRAQGKDHPRKRRLLDTDGHISNNWFRNHIWKPTVAASNIQHSVRIHDLRHAHASWLLAGGADIQVVKERLGHSSIATTERYLHTLPEADETALDALTKIRTRAAR
jgi:integrase